MRMREDQYLPTSVMEQIYEEIKTPYKYGLVVVPPDNTKMRGI